MVGLAIVEIPTTILASAGTPTAIKVPKTVWTPTTHDFLEKFLEKLFITAKKIMKKAKKRVKIPYFLSERFWSVR